MAITGSHEQQGAKDSRIDKPSRLLKCPVIPMVEANADAHIAPGGALRESFQLASVPRGRFLDEYVLAGIDRSTHDLGLHIVWRGDDDRLHIHSVHELAPARPECAARTPRGHLGRARQIRIDTMDQPGARQVLSPALTDYAAANDAHIQSTLPQLRSRSAGTMRRSV
jgi:hypothetical protein